MSGGTGVTLETLSEVVSHGGVQGVYRHASAATHTDMTFSLFMPPEVEKGEPLPVLWYLSGLTCTHANVTEKGEFRAACAEAGVILIAPDTSPRGEVSGAMKIIPALAQAARYSPFSVTLAWVQVSPDRYHSTGNGSPRSTCGGMNRLKVMSLCVTAEE